MIEADLCGVWKHVNEQKELPWDVRLYGVHRVSWDRELLVLQPVQPVPVHA